MANLELSSWQESLSFATTQVVTNILSYLPTFFAAIIVFILGVLVANWAKALTIKILNALKLSALVKKSQIKPFLDKAEITLRIEDVIGSSVKWLLLLVFFNTTLNILGLTTISLVLSSILGYIPRIVSAILVFLVGVLLAGVVETVVKGALAQIDMKLARLLGKLASYLVVIFTTLAAISELGIAQSFVTAIFIGVIATLSLGIGLALGLGAKDLVAALLEEWYLKLKKDLK